MNIVTTPQFERFLTLLGRLNYTWTNTESLLIHLIAGLAGTDKEKATVIFLTLNTTRARIDLVDRLVKLDADKDLRTSVLEITGEFQKLSVLRNRYNHCIYAHDAESGAARSIMMRIADRKQHIEIGRAHELDAAAVQDVADTIENLSGLNDRIWRLVVDRDFPQ